MAKKSSMKLFAKIGWRAKVVMVGLGLMFLFPNAHASGLPEWGMSSGPAVFMIRAVAIKSPPLNVPVSFIGARSASPRQQWPVTTSWLEGYMVSITNVTMVYWTKPVIQYVVFAMDSTGQIQRVRGTEELNEIPVNGKITLITDQVMMQRSIRGNGHNILPGKLLGIWIRIYDHKHRLIQNYAAPWALMVWQRWEFPLYTEGGGLVTPLQPGVKLGW
jgi:hypothetical protein